MVAGHAHAKSPRPQRMGAGGATLRARTPGPVTGSSLRAPGEQSRTVPSLSPATGEGSARVVACVRPTNLISRATTEEPPSAVSTQPPERPPTRPDRPQGPGTPGPAPKPWSRWVTVIVIAAIAVVLFMTAVGSNDTSKVSLSYTKFTNQVNQGHVTKVDYDPNSGKISGDLSEPLNGRTQFTSAGPNNNLTDNDLADLRKKGVQINYVREGSNPWLPILIYLLPIAALIGFFVWMNRRAQGQMGAVMNIGKSKAKV